MCPVQSHADAKRLEPRCPDPEFSTVLLLLDYNFTWSILSFCFIFFSHGVGGGGTLYLFTSAKTEEKILCIIIEQGRLIRHPSALSNRCYCFLLLPSCHCCLSFHLEGLTRPSSDRMYNIQSNINQSLESGELEQIGSASSSRRKRTK